MKSNQTLILVSHFGAGLLADAVNILKPFDAELWVKDLERGKTIEIKHKISAATLAPILDKLATMRLDFSTIAPAPKKLFIADMDSTIISCECLDELADFAGKKNEVSAITERAMAGELNFEAALAERVMMLKGLQANALEQCFAERVRLNQGALVTISALKQNGAYCSLVSGGFKFFTSRVRDWVGFDEDNSNQFIFENNALTGEVELPILGKEAKLVRLNHLCATRNIDIKDTIAIGDGANDLMMIEAAGLGIAYMAKPIVAARAPARINSGNLESVVAFCGFI